MIQVPSLPDMEMYLHVKHAELIQKFEKSLESDPEFPCCSCERLLLRKQVTALKFDEKFSSEMWKTRIHTFRREIQMLQKRRTTCATTVVFGSTKTRCHAGEF